MGDRFEVIDSRRPTLVESKHDTLNDALRAAIKSGLDVYLHADTCEMQKLDALCPCRPVCIPARGYRG